LYHGITFYNLLLNKGVKFWERSQLTVYETHRFHFGTAGQFHVGKAPDVLMKDVFDSVLLYAKFAKKFVTASQGSLEGHSYTGNNRIDAALVEFGEGDALAQKIFVAGMFEIVLIVCIVDNALQVAFVVTNLKGNLVCHK